MRAPALAKAAAIVLFAQGGALAILTVPELFILASGGASNTVTAIALIVLTLIGAGALVAFGFGTRVGNSMARSGGVVAQVLALALVAASLTVPPVQSTFVFGVGLPAVLGLVLLLASARREGKADRAPREDDGPTVDEA